MWQYRAYTILLLVFGLDLVLLDVVGCSSGLVCVSDVGAGVFEPLGPPVGLAGRKASIIYRLVMYKIRRPARDTRSRCP